MTEQREGNLAPLGSRGPSVGPCSEQKMETLMCAIHLHVRGVCVLCECTCVCVCVMYFIDRCSDSTVVFQPVWGRRSSLFWFVKSSEAADVRNQNSERFVNLCLFFFLLHFMHEHADMVEKVHESKFSISEPKQISAITTVWMNDLAEKNVLPRKLQI